MNDWQMILLAFQARYLPFQQQHLVDDAVILTRIQVFHSEYSKLL